MRFFPEGADRTEVLEQMAACLKELAEAAFAQGLIVSLEDYDNASSPIATAEGMKWFADHVPGVGITFDTGNFSYAGEDELEAFELLQDRIVHVHCKDRADRSLWGEQPTRTMDGRKIYPCPFGAGFIRTDEILDRLQAIGYDTIAAGDSYNDLEMIEASKAGFLFRTTEKIKQDYPQLPAFEEFDELMGAIKKEMGII